jgi:hypothetical protein
LKPSPLREAANDLPEVIRKDFEHRQREFFLPKPRPKPTEPRLRLIQEIQGDHPMADPQSAGQWFDCYGADLYLRDVTEETGLWWDQAEAGLPVRSQNNLKALAAHLIAVAPGAFLRATLPELQTLVGRRSVASYLVNFITEVVDAKLAIALLREGAHVAVPSAAIVAGPERQFLEKDSVASPPSLQALAAVRKPRWGDFEARRALQLVCSRGYSVHGISKTAGIPRSTLQRFFQGKAKILGAERLPKLIGTLYPIVRELAKRHN